MKLKNNFICEQCIHEYLGKYCIYEFEEDISIINEICPCFININPLEIKFDTLWQLESYLREYFYTTDFYNNLTRPKLKNMLEFLYPHIVKQNYANRAFSNMCKKRMIKHIEFYIKLHGLKCKGE